MRTNDKERERGGFFDIVAGELTNCIIRKIHDDGTATAKSKVTYASGVIR